MNVQAPHLERLGIILKQRIDAHNGVTLPELRTQYPELTVFPYTALWHQIINLEQNGYIRIDWTHRNPICYSVE